MQTFDRVAIKAEAKKVFYRNRSLCVSMALLVLLANVVLATVSAGLLSLLLTGVIGVTASGFYLECWRDRPISVGQAISATFDEGFLRKMGGMLWMELKIFLWSLLLVIPGIVKVYSYVLTPYILYECPGVPAMEASRLSERMMRGHRAEVFVAQLSFLGWNLLSAMTLGIVNVLFSGPYSELTFAGIYDEIKQLALETGAVTADELEGRATY